MRDEIASRLKYWAFRFEGKGVQESQASDAMHAASLYIEQLVGIVAELRVKAFSDAELLDDVRGDAERWKQSYHDALAGGDVLKAEVERLREALAWYADPANHQPIRTRSSSPDFRVLLVEEPPIAFDGGERAREALEGAP